MFQDFGGEFNFRLRTPDTEPEYKGATLKPGYAVFLPHQCDEWEIAGDPSGYVLPQHQKDIGDVMDSLAKFIAEATAVYDFLKQSCAPKHSRGFVHVGITPEECEVCKGRQNDA